MTTPELSARFAHVRSVLHQRPSAAAWRALSELLVGWPPEHLAQVVYPYAQDLLSRWSDEIQRGAYIGWASVEQGRLIAHHPGLTLINTWYSDRSASPDHARALAQPGVLPMLTTLHLHDGWIGDEGARALARPDALPTLRVLRLGRDHFSDEGVAALAQRQGLLELSLRSRAWGDDGVRALASSPAMATLRTLHLEGDFTDAAAYALASSTHLSQLSTLTLPRRHLSQDALATLASSPNLSERVRRSFATTCPP